jgi:hypothetical protein
LNLTWSTHARLLDEDTHLSLRTEARVIGCVPLRNVPSKSITTYCRIRIRVRSARTSPSTFPFLPSSQCQRPDLSPLSGSTSVEAVLPNFCGQEARSGFPAAPLPFQISAPQPPRSAAAPVKSDGGVYCRVFLLSTPRDDKIDIFGNAEFTTSVCPRLSAL